MGTSLQVVSVHLSDATTQQQHLAAREEEHNCNVISKWVTHSFWLVDCTSFTYVAKNGEIYHFASCDVRIHGSELCGSLQRWTLYLKGPRRGDGSRSFAFSISAASWFGFWCGHRWMKYTNRRRGRTHQHQVIVNILSMWNGLLCFSTDVFSQKWKKNSRSTNCLFYKCRLFFSLPLTWRSFVV